MCYHCNVPICPVLFMKEVKTFLSNLSWILHCKYHSKWKALKRSYVLKISPVICRPLSQMYRRTRFITCNNTAGNVRFISEEIYCSEFDEHLKDKVWTRNNFLLWRNFLASPITRIRLVIYFFMTIWVSVS